MRTLLVLLLLSVGSSFAQTIRHFECLGPMVGGSNESSRVAATMAGGPYNGTVHAVIIYCVDPGANDLLPTYFLQLPALYEDFYRRSSSGQLDLVIDAVLSRDPDHAFVATVGHGTSGFVCSDQFMRDVFSQVDATYDLGQFDNDGPDGLANSGDDDGNVDMVFFWLLNASTRGVFPLYDLLQSYVTADTSWGPNHTYRGRIEISPANGFENRKDLHDVAVGMVDWLGPTLHESGHALGRFPDMEHSGLTNYDHYALGSFEVMSNGGCLRELIEYPGISMVLYGFNGWPSLFNPWFRAERGWATYVDVTQSVSGVQLQDLDSTGQVIRFSPSAVPSDATPINRFLITYHRYDPANPWIRNWPLDQQKGGVLFWHASNDWASMSDNYSDRGFLPISLQSAHGKRKWQDTLDLGIEDPLLGLDSVLIRKLGIDGKPHWWPYKGSSLGMATKSVFFTPGEGKNITFYSNPNSNLYTSSANENHARSVTSGFSMKDLRFTNGATFADFLVNDFTITENATLHAGTWHIKNTVTVSAGASLTISPGTILKFEPSTSLIVNGRLIAQGTSQNPISMTSSGSSWNGLVLNGSGANNSILEYATVQDVQTYGGSAVAVVGASGVSIKHCTISNNVNYGTSGLYLGNAGWPEIAYSKISGNGGYGIVLSNSYGYIYRDTISANPYGGIFCNGWASPAFGAIGLDAYNGNNTISGGTYGINACAYSYPFVGLEDNTYYGYNSITGGTTARIYASGNSEVMAEVNFWGVHPHANWFIAQGGSIIDWQPYLEDPPGSVAAPGDSPVLAEDEVDQVDIADAVRFRTLGECAQAKSILRGAITTKLQNEAIRRVGPELVALDALTQDPELLEICQGILAKEDILDPVFVLAEAKILQQRGRTWEARAKLMDLLTTVSGTEFESQVIHDIGLGEVVSALTGQGINPSTKSMLGGSSSQEVMANINWLLSLASSKSRPEAPIDPNRSLASDAAPNSIGAAAFPNPFNPTTTIRYGLPTRSQVLLTVFNTLGQQIALLQNGEQEAGYHEVKFDASGISSGVYFYRLRVGDFVQSRKLLLLR